MREKSFNTSLDKCSALKCFQSAWTCRINKKKTIYDKYSILLIKASGELSKHLIKSVCSNNLAAQDQTHPLLLQRRTSWCSLPFVLVLCGPPPHPLFALLSPQVPWGSDVPKNHGRSFLKPSPLHNHNRECLNFVASHSIFYALFANILYISTFVVNNIPLCHLLSYSIDFHLSWDISRSFHLEASTNHTAHSMWKGFTKQVSVCSVCASLFQ